jgi:molybdenum cofactor cytidylyltransferase
MIAAVVLAAGASTRMGQPKALLQRRDGKRYADAIAATARAAGCEHVVVVVGPPHGDAIRAAIGEATAWNPDPARGMLSSVQAGIAALPSRASAALIWPVDIPFVNAATVRELIAQRGTIIVPVHNNRGGHPLFIVRAHFDEIAALDPARGLKALVDAHRDEVVRLPVEDAAVLVDVDTPDDYACTRD